MGTPYKELLKHPSFSGRRLPSLYSDFRNLKDSNPDGYEANVVAWKSALVSLVRTGDVFEDKVCIPVDEMLLNGLESPVFHHPLALDVVLDCAVQDNTFVPISVFLSQSFHVYNTSWPSLGSIASWALRKSGLYDSSWKSAASPGKLKPEKYVCISVLNSVAKRFLDTVRQDAELSYTRSVFTRDLLYSTYNTITLNKHKIHLTSTDLECIILYLNRDLGQISVENDTVKFAPGPVSEQDRAVANLRYTIEQVSHRVDHLSDQIVSCRERAKQALVDGNKVTAAYALRSKKMAVTTQTKSVGMLENLQQTLDSIDTAVSQVDILKALDSSVNILSSLNKAVGGAEQVARLMDELDDNRAEVDEIGHEISRLAPDVEVDDELDLLEQEELQKRRALEQLANQEPTNETERLPSSQADTITETQDLEAKLAELRLERAENQKKRNQRIPLENS